MKINFARCRRFHAEYYLKIDNLNDILHFKYPKFSNLFFFVELIINLINFYFLNKILFLGTLIFKMNYLLIYFILSLIVIVLYNKPGIKSYVIEYLNNNYFKTEYLNKKYIQPLVETKKQSDSTKYSNLFIFFYLYILITLNLYYFNLKLEIDYYVKPLVGKKWQFIKNINQ